MKIKALCKICHKPLEVECDDKYPALSDPHKLIPMITCNRCYDLRDREIAICNQLYRCCILLIQCSEKARAELKSKLLDALRMITQRYARWFQEKENGPTIIWDGEFAQLIADHPDKWQSLLNDYKRHAKNLWRDGERQSP